MRGVDNLCDDFLLLEPVDFVNIRCHMCFLCLMLLPLIMAK